MPIPRRGSSNSGLSFTGSLGTEDALAEQIEADSTPSLEADIETHAEANQRSAGSEPGIDVHRSSEALMFKHIFENCMIDVIDYGGGPSDFSREFFTNVAFGDWLQASADVHPTMNVRWINIVGISWDVVSALAERYPLHPLAIEDLLTDRISAPSKAEYFSQHLFIRAAGHELLEDHPPECTDKKTRPHHNQHQDSKSSNKDPKQTPAKSVTHHEKRDIESHGKEQKKRDRFGLLHRRRQQRATLRATIRELKRSEGINCALRSMCIFLMRDGTVISFRKSTHRDFTAPIRSRLERPDTSLRSVPDPSMLVHALLDLVVDTAWEALDAYQDRLMELEEATLFNPKMETIRSLHIISGDLILQKTIMGPLKQLIYGLRRYDMDRCIALAQEAHSYPHAANLKDVDPSSVKVFMSLKAKVYLADVQDHLEHMLASMDMFAATAENLINFIFNSNSNSMNESMRRFTIVTIVCLPMTLLTGYFGMNFEKFSAIKRSDGFFWLVALPVLAVTILVCTWELIGRSYGRLKHSTVVARRKRHAKGHHRASGS